MTKHQLLKAIKKERLKNVTVIFINPSLFELLEKIHWRHAPIQNANGEYNLPVIRYGQKVVSACRLIPNVNVSGIYPYES